MESIWKKTAEMPRFPALEGDARTDVLIIGGGIAGILCARALTDRGADCLLLEEGRLCGGVTGNTSAKVTAQHGLFCQKLLPVLGEERTRLYVEANLKAVEKIRALSREIDCDFREEDAYVFSRTATAPLAREREALGRVGCRTRLVREVPLPFPVAGALKLEGQGCFHPLKFLAAMAEGLNIREGTKVLELAPGEVMTHAGRVKANKIIVATHFPVLNKHGGYSLKLYQHRSYALALENVPEIEGMYVEDTGHGLSFRMAGERLILGGGGHRTGHKGGGWGELRALAHKWWPECREAAHWAAQDCITLDGGAYVGQYSPGTPGLYVATGFNKWGMTTAMAAADILCDLTAGRANIYASAFDPHRHMALGAALANACASAADLLTPTRPRCPHLGCALKYNREEHSWDCPCHGSRFGENGVKLDGPATADLQRPPER